VSFFDRIGVRRVLRTTTVLGRLRRNIGSTTMCCALCATSRKSHALESDSESRTAIDRRTRSCSCGSIRNRLRPATADPNLLIPQNLDLTRPDSSFQDTNSCQPCHSQLWVVLSPVRVPEFTAIAMLPGVRKVSNSIRFAEGNDRCDDLASRCAVNARPERPEFLGAVATGTRG
jgi:hypothetical protein